MKKSIDEVTPIDRHMAKSLNFGLAYGMSANGLAKRLDIPVKEASAFRIIGISAYATVSFDYIETFRKVS